MVTLPQQNRWAAALLRLLAACALAWSSPAALAAVTASVNRQVITLGETVTLSLSIDGAQGQQPRLPALPNFQVVGTGSSFVQNPDGSVQQSFTFELAPTQAGDLVIPSLQFNAGGRISATQPIAVKVLKQNESGPAPPIGLVRIVLPKTNLFVGEVVDMDVQVYMQEGRLTQYPQLSIDPGMTLGKWLKPTETRVALSNVAYSLVTFRAPITAVKAGALSVGPATEPLIVIDRSARPTFFFRNEREVRLTADAVKAIALPLPTNNVPATFGGAVGQYSVTMTAAPTNVAVGDPITVRIQIAGNGWLDSVTFPRQPLWQSFKMYTPSAKVESSDPNNTRGTKTFEVAMLAQSAAIAELPPFTFSFFDPQAGEYRTVTTPAVPLAISASTAAGIPLPRATATNSPADAGMSEIAHIKPELGSVVARASLVSRPWFLLLQFVAPATWLALVVRRKRAESIAANPRLRRRRETALIEQQVLAAMRTEAAANNSDAFFASLVRALQNRIAERLDVAPNSIGEAIVSDRLRPANLPEPACRTIEELFHAANVARYAPAKSIQEFHATLARTEAVLKELENWSPNP